ncbi:uncharacterized protein [Typha angustifolia]|uniref:uncharacterized protein n=1 Tax=Typha angustifolia TaxID=59011 RepID=UPI003C2B2D3C
MGSSEPFASAISEDVGCNLCFHSNICGESDGFSVQEIGVTLSQVLHVHDENELVHDDLASSSDDTCDEMEMPSLPLNSNLSEGLNNSEAVAYHEVGESHLQNLNVGQKIISAIKGSRAQQGILLNSKLSVKWAQDVYDPPVTSESHTVKGHRQRHKFIKDYYKHKHTKSKNSRNSSDRKHIHRSNSNDRKHVHRSSSHSSSSSRAIDQQMLRLQDERSLVSNFFLSKVEDVLDHPVGVQEFKCRGSFCVESSLAPVRLPLGEAS